MDEKNKYSCEEHLDLAFDDFILENETFPCLENDEKHICCYCNTKSKYSLKLNKDNL